MLCFICLKGKKNNNIAVVWLVSHVRLFVIPWTAASQASLLFTISRSLLKLMSIESVSDAIQPSVVPFSSCLQSFPASGSFSMSWLRWPKYWSFSFSISLPMNIQGWFPLGLTGLVSLLSKGLSRVFSSTMVLAGTLFCISETHSSVEYCWFFSIFQFFIFLFYLQGESLILS